MERIIVSAIQTVSTTDVNENIKRVENLIKQAVLQNAQWIVLPEYWVLMGKNEEDKVKIAETFRQPENTIQTTIAQWAKEYQITIFAGSIPLRSPIDGKIYNSLLTFNAQGQCISRYDKKHLFGFYGIGEKYQESDTIVAGNTIPNLQHQQWQIAQGICFDLRFPEFFVAQGVFDVIILPAAFTYTTGRAHWETLIKARAIENQCYVIAAAQGGIHQNGRRTFGHSMIIDPWGKIIALAKEGEACIVAEISQNRIKQVRNHLPAVILR